MKFRINLYFVIFFYAIYIFFHCFHLIYQLEILPFCLSISTMSLLKIITSISFGNILKRNIFQAAMQEIISIKNSTFVCHHIFEGSTALLYIPKNIKKQQSFIFCLKHQDCFSNGDEQLLMHISTYCHKVRNITTFSAEKSIRDILLREGSATLKL